MSEMSEPRCSGCHNAWGVPEPGQLLCRSCQWRQQHAVWLAGREHRALALARETGRPVVVERDAPGTVPINGTVRMAYPDGAVVVATVDWCGHTSPAHVRADWRGAITLPY